MEVLQSRPSALSDLFHLSSSLVIKHITTHYVNDSFLLFEADVPPQVPAQVLSFIVINTLKQLLI